MAGLVGAARPVLALCLVIALSAQLPVSAATDGLAPNVAPTLSPAAATTTVYLPNVTRMLGGPDGWQTPFIVQNVGAVATDVTMSFYAFADGTLVKTRTVAGLQPGNSVFHDPNSDTELPAGGQFSVVVQSTSSPIVVVVNEHQNVQNSSRQEALSYQGLSQGSTMVFAPYFANNLNGWLTTLIVQDLGSQSTTASLTFVSFDGTRTVTLTRDLQPGRAAFVDPRFEAGLAAGVEYGVSLKATQPLGVVINAHNDAATVAAPRGFSYNGSPANDFRTNYLAYVAKNGDVFGRTSRIFVQNATGKAEKPHLLLCPLNNSSCPSGVGAVIDGPATLAPGAVWAYDMATSVVPDGDYSVSSISNTGESNFVAMVAATLSPGTAMGSSATGIGRTKWYLPNVTRTLGGPNGWTTPIVIQSASTGTTTARLSWYRFTDGALVTQQYVTGLQISTGVRVDPRDVAQLSDNTQYAVLVEAPAFGVSVVVTELNFLGGDGAMAYEGFAPPEAAGFGTTGCTPTSAAGGAVFWCRFYGLPAGASPVAFTAQGPSGNPSTTSGAAVAADGSATIDWRISGQGVYTFTASAGGVTLNATATVLNANFSVSTTQSKNGAITVQTKSGIPCTLWVTRPDGSTAPQFANRGILTVFADQAGSAAFAYTPISPITSPIGTYRNVVHCTSGAETLGVEPTFTVP